MIELNSAELLSANQVINLGLAKAAESLSFFMKEKISFIAQEDHAALHPPDVRLSEKPCEAFYLLITEVVGQIKGVCCLIFSEEEAEQLRCAALPESVKQDPGMMKEMSDAILLEVDNIISAAVITQFSNILKKKMHGGIPQLRKISFGELSEFIAGKVENNSYIIRFKTSFVSSRLNFSPEFIWLFDHEFVDSVRALAAEEAKTAR